MQGGVGKGGTGGSEGVWKNGTTLIYPYGRKAGRTDGRREGDVDGGKEEWGRRRDVCKDERRWRGGRETCRGGRDSFLWDGWVDLIRDGWVGGMGKEGEVN